MTFCLFHTIKTAAERLIIGYGRVISMTGIDVVPCVAPGSFRLLEFLQQQKNNWMTFCPVRSHGNPCTVSYPQCSTIEVLEPIEYYEFRRVGLPLVQAVLPAGLYSVLGGLREELLEDGIHELWLSPLEEKKRVEIVYCGSMDDIREERSVMPDWRKVRPRSS